MRRLLLALTLGAGGLLVMAMTATANAQEFQPPALATPSTCAAFASEIRAAHRSTYEAVMRCQRRNSPTIGRCPQLGLSMHAWAPVCCNEYAASKRLDNLWSEHNEQIRECRRRANLGAEDEKLDRAEKLMDTIEDGQALLSDPLGFFQAKAGADKDLIDMVKRDYRGNDLAGSPTERLYQLLWRTSHWGRAVRFRGAPPLVREIQERSIQLLRMQFDRIENDLDIALRRFRNFDARPSAPAPRRSPANTYADDEDDDDSSTMTHE